MNTFEYESMDGLALADLLRRGETTPGELMRCAISLSRQRAPAFNALCYENYEQGQADADAWQQRGLFRGLPFLLKDSGLGAQAFASSLGSNLFNDTAFDYDATLVSRFYEAGFVPFARTTVPELCMAPTTEAIRNGGATLNPWDTRRSPGGSSGGAAVAVAIGLVPIAHGSDGGGSIRAPAACCGVFGLKPSRGRVPMGPKRGEGWGGLACEGVLTRTVRDTAAALDAIAGYEEGAPYAAPPASGSYLAEVLNPRPGRLRIGVVREAWGNLPVATECVQAVEHVAQLCSEAGHEVIDMRLPDIAFDELVQGHINVLAANIATSADARLQMLGRGLQAGDLEPAMMDGYECGKRLSAQDYIKAITNFHSVGRAMAGAMENVDIILSPSLTQLPAILGELTMVGAFHDFRMKIASYMPFLAALNASGQPAANVPVHWTDAGVPVGVQVIGRFGREDQVLALAAQLEAHAPWRDRYMKFSE